MTILEIILTGIIWIAYGVFNSWQHKWFIHSDWETFEALCCINILCAPIALCIRIIRGVFIWKGKYK